MKMGLNKDEKAVEKIDPAFRQFQDTELEAENADVKDVNTRHMNHSVDVEGQNGNFEMGLWENRNPKEMSADDQLEEDDGGIGNKTSIILPSVQAFQENPNQIPKIAEVSALNPFSPSRNKTVNYGMESIRRPQLPTKKSVAPLVQKMMQIDAINRGKPEDVNANVLNKPLLIPQRHDQEAMLDAQNIEAPNIPENKFINQ